MRNLSEEEKIVLEGLGFQMKRDGLWNKDLPEGGTAYWDFRKKDQGKYYVTMKDGSFADDTEAKKMVEYTTFRNTQEGKDFQKASELLLANQSQGQGPARQTNQEVQVILRGNETQISNLVMQRNLEMIARASTDGKGESILYHNLGKSIGMEPSAELIDMITQSMGDIAVDVLEHGQRKHMDPETDEIYHTYYAIVVAKDMKSGTEGLGTAEEIIDFTEMKKQGRTFAMTKAIRKAERNAKERLIPVPRKALVELVQELISSHVSD